MRRILLSSALIALLAGPALAQAPSSEPAPQPQAAPPAAPPTGMPPEVKHPVPPATPAQPQAAQPQAAQPQAAQPQAAQPQAAQPQAAQPQTAQPQAAPGGTPLAGPQQQREGQKATSGTPLPSSGARQEPGATEQKVADGPPLVDGRLNAPGAPQHGHTVPAKTSERNAKLDAMPMLQPRDAPL